MNKTDTILLVEDNSLQRQALTALFEDAGFRVYPASTGDQALKLGQEHQPNLAVLDVNLPDMNGFELCRQLKSYQREGREPFVLMTSGVFTTSSDRMQGLEEEGADIYLTKPFTGDELLASVRALQRTRRAEMEWQNTFDAISDIVCLVTLQGTIRRCNRALCELVGLPFAELIGKALEKVLVERLHLDVVPPVLACIHSVAPPHTHSAPALRSRPTFEMPLGARWFRVTADPLPRLSSLSSEELPEGPSVAQHSRSVQTLPELLEPSQGYVLILTDITQNKFLEEQVRRGLRLEAISRLAGGIAHDFNNLLTAILGNASILLQRLSEKQNTTTASALSESLSASNMSSGESDRADSTSLPSSHSVGSAQAHSRNAKDSDYHLLASLERAAWRAAELTRQLLGFSQQAMLNLRTADLNKALTEVARSVEHMTQAIQVELRLSENLWLVQADTTQIIQALMNLVRNALTAMPTGGRLILESDNVEVTAEHAQGRLEARAGVFVRLRITDTGQGMPPEVLEHLFEPFFTTQNIVPSTTNRQGSGLGLAMVYGSILQHNGWIECQSHLDKGTCFSVFLPCDRTALVGARHSPHSTSTSTNNNQSSIEIPALVRQGRVLVADDNDLLRNLLNTQLRELGFDVLPVASLDELLRELRNLENQIQLLVLDRHLLGPQEERSWSRVREVVREVPVLLLSSAETADELLDLRNHLGVRLLTRPYREQDLRIAIREVLN